MRGPGRLALAVGVVVALCGVVRAGIIYDNGGPNTSSGVKSDVDGPVWAADDFTLDAPAVIRDVHWWGFYGMGNTPPAEDHWTIRFHYLMDDAVPDASPFVDFEVGDASVTVIRRG